MSETESPGEGENQRRKRKYLLPSRETILDAARSLSISGRTIDSQEKLRKLVLKKLLKDNELYRVSGKRIRKILIRGGVAKVQIIAREAEGKRPYFLCPVCDSKLTKIVNQTLDGTNVVIGYRCPICGYWTHQKKRVPMRYIFSLKKV